MTTAEKSSIAREYQARFTNWADLLHPSVVFEPAFISLVKKAIKTGKRLTRKKIESKFGPVAWNW